MNNPTESKPVLARIEDKAGKVQQWSEVVYFSQGNNRWIYCCYVGKEDEFKFEEFPDNWRVVQWEYVDVVWDVFPRSPTLKEWLEHEIFGHDIPYEVVELFEHWREGVEARIRSWHTLDKGYSRQSWREYAYEAIPPDQKGDFDLLVNRGRALMGEVPVEAALASEPVKEVSHLDGCVKVCQHPRLKCGGFMPSL